MADERLEALERLADLKGSGALTDDEAETGEAENPLQRFRRHNLLSGCRPAAVWASQRPDQTSMDGESVAPGGSERLQRFKPCCHLDLDTSSGIRDPLNRCCLHLRHRHPRSRPWRTRMVYYLHLPHPRACDGHDRHLHTSSSCFNQKARIVT